MDLLVDLFPRSTDRGARNHIAIWTLVDLSYLFQIYSSVRVRARARARAWKKRKRSERSTEDRKVQYYSGALLVDL